MIVQSNGMGVQSVALSVMFCLGELPMPTLSIFADTGWELPETYSYLEWFQGWASERGLNIAVAQKGNIRADAFKAERWANMPLYTMGVDGKATPILRQCSLEYKIAVVNKIVREKMGLVPGAIHKGEPATIVMGYSMDEIERMKEPGAKWYRFAYPLIDIKRMDRAHCEAYIKSKGLPIPEKSACVGCPWRSDSSWASMKKHRPASFEDACDFDDKIRWARPGMTGACYLHKSLVPLREAYIGEDQGDMFINECEGPCNT